MATITCNVCKTNHSQSGGIIFSSNSHNAASQTLVIEQPLVIEQQISEIQRLHHDYLVLHLPLIKGWVHQVSEELPHNRHLVELCDIVDMLNHRLLAHAQEEDESIFPALIAVEGGHAPAGIAEFLKEIVETHRLENRTLWNMLAKIRKLTGEYRIPPDASETMVSLILHLKDLDENLQEHLQKELRLYPRVFAILGLDDAPLRAMMNY